MLLAISRFCDIFNNKNYWDINQSESSINVESVKFIMDPGYSNIKDPHFPSLMALICIDEATLVFVDGYHQNLFYRCQRMFISMLSYVLPDKLTRELVTNKIRYMKVNTENEYVNTKIHLIDEAKTIGTDTVDLSVVPWEVYSREILSELYTGNEPDIKMPLN
tara:strand:- start:810 stop:1298 length:489 start_codon:yes stop_codon:yes gene_type:complete